MDQLSQGRSLQSLLNLIAIIVKLSMPNWTNGCMSDDNLTQLKPPLFKIAEEGAKMVFERSGSRI